MRTRLLKSFLTVLLFWGVATTLWWSLKQPHVQWSSLARVHDSILGRMFPFSMPPDGILSSLFVQKLVLTHWSLPVLALTIVSLLVGVGAVIGYTRMVEKERNKSAAGSGEHQGISVTAGELPAIRVLPRDEISLSGEPELVANFTPPQLALFEQILGTLSAHPDAYPGAGVRGPLLDHTLQVCTKALQRKRNPALAALSAGGWELGKLNAYSQRDDQSWVRIRDQGVEAGLALPSMPALFDLPTVEREALLLAVRYREDPRQMPEVEGNLEAYRLAWDLLNYAEEAATQVVETQVAQTLAETEPDSVFSVFMQELPQLAFQNRGLPRGVPAVAWKTGRRVYFLEMKLRQLLSEKLPAHLREALNKAKKGKMHPLTDALAKSFDERGWLVKSAQEVNLTADEALWVVRAGKMDFNGVLVVDLPDDLRTSLPADDTPYEMAIVRPLFAKVSGTVAPSDLIGELLMRKPAAPAEEAAAV